MRENDKKNYFRIINCINPVLVVFIFPAKRGLLLTSMRKRKESAI